MTKEKVSLITDESQYLLSHYVNEWKLLSQHVNEMDRGYMNFLTLFAVIATVTVTIMSLITESSDSGIAYIFYVIPLAFIAVFGYMGYQFRITAILRGHLARIEDEMNKLLGESVYMWNSSLVEVYMAHNNVPNNTLMIPVLVFIIATASVCVMETFAFGVWWVNIIYWTIVVGLALLVLIPFFLNETVRKKTYHHEDIIKKYENFLQK